MNIYIYGNKDFKKEINRVLDKSNVKFRLDQYGKIEEIDSLEALKMHIEENPDYIFLIDDKKIIKNGAFDKFFAPKDGIEEKFLKDNGVGDLNIDSIEDLPKHIIKKLEAMHLNDDLDEADEKKEPSDEDIHDSIVDIIENGYKEDEEKEDIDLDLKKESNLEEPELDEELSSLLAHDEKNENDFDMPELDEEPIENLSSSNDDLDALIDGIDEPVNDDLESLINEIDNTNENSNDDDLDALISEIDDSNDNDDLNSLINELDNSNIQDLDSELQNFDLDDISESQMQSALGEEPIVNTPTNSNMSVSSDIGNLSMDDDFSELDTLNESDILAALEGIDTINIDSIAPALANETPNTQVKDGNGETINLSSDNAGDIAKLISELLNHKTVEITIKIKE